MRTETKMMTTLDDELEAMYRRCLASRDEMLIERAKLHDSFNRLAQCAARVCKEGGDRDAF